MVRTYIAVDSDGPVSVVSTMLVLHHGGPVHLPAGRYWVGDSETIGHRHEVIHDPVVDSGQDGIYAKDGVIVGAFCRSIHPAAKYGMYANHTLALPQIEALHGPLHGYGRHIVTKHIGVSILPIDDFLAAMVNSTDKAINGLVFETDAPFVVVRRSMTYSDPAIISLVNADGVYLLTLELQGQ